MPQKGNYNECRWPPTDNLRKGWVVIIVSLLLQQISFRVSVTFLSWPGVRPSSNFRAYYFSREADQRAFRKKICKIQNFSQLGYFFMEYRRFLSKSRAKNSNFLGPGGEGPIWNFRREEGRARLGYAHDRGVHCAVCIRFHFRSVMVLKTNNKNGTLTTAKFLRGWGGIHKLQGQHFFLPVLRSWPRTN